MLIVVCLTLEVFAALALLGVQFVPWTLQLPALFAVATTFGIIRAFYPAASSAILPMLIPRSALPSAIALGTMSFQLGVIIGPAIGGFLFAVSPVAVYGTAACLLFAGVIATVLIKTDTRPQGAARRGVEMVMEGLRYVWGNKVLFGAIFLDLVVVLLAGATALLPAFARDVLNAGPWALGFLRAAPAVGALCVSVLIARRPITRHVGRWMLGSVAVFGLATIGFGFARALPLSFLALFVAGAADTVSVVVRESLLQFMTPDAMRGRVASVNMLFISASNELGEFESGVAARFLGPVGAVLFGGIGAILVGLFWGNLFPKLRDADRYEHLDETKATAEKAR
jgi:MFS family permease